MNIAVVTSSYPRFEGDGAGTFVYSLVQALTRAGHRVHVLAPDDARVDQAWQPAVPAHRLRYVWPRRWALVGHANALSGDVRMKGRAYPLVALFAARAVLGLWRTVRRQRCDVIFAQWLVPGGLIGAVVSAIAGVPLVIAAHGSDVFVAERNALGRFMARWALRRARRVIACSQDLTRRVSRLGAGPDRVVAIPYGVDGEHFSPDPASRDWLRRTQRIAPEQPIVVAMGRLVYKKGFDTLIAALPAILSTRPATRLIIAGDGELRAELEAQAVDLGIRRAVTFAGHVPWQSAQRWLSGADIVAVPSVIDHSGNVDGLPNVLLEAMACGACVVASDVAGIPDVIADEVNGVLVPPGEPGPLAAAIIRLLAAPAERTGLGQAARRTAVEDLGWDKIAARTQAVLESAIAGKSRGR